MLKLLFKLFIVTFFLISCSQKSQKLFTELSSSQTHIDFRNDIKEDDKFNILTYEYLYNGGGVAVGDINNDGLPDIIFTGNMTSNKLYLNKGNFEFEDITDKAGIKGRPGWKTGVVMADVNGDGLLDIYVCYSGPGTDDQRTNELYINNGVKNGVPSFKECAKKYGLDAPGTFTTTVSFFDMDNDGDLDMFMVNHADMFYNPYFNTDKLRSTRDPKFGNRLYRNDNGHFTDISEQAHINGSGLNFGLGVAISDLNNDGWPDIYTTNDYDERDFMYLNNHDGTFREVLPSATGHISRSAMGCDIADYNNDNKPDIMVLDMKPEDNRRQKLLNWADTYDNYTKRINAGLYKQQNRNTLQLNNGVDSNGVPLFSEIAQFAGVSNTDWSWAPLFADFDNDGYKDLFISNGILRDMTNLDFVKYTSGYSDKYIKPSDSKSEWKLIQQMPSSEFHNYLFRNNHDLSFTDVTQNWGLTKNSFSNGSVYADLNNDGSLDLIINNLNGKATIYRNNANETTPSHYVRIRLKGNNKNTFGIGAKVYVQTTHTHQMQEEYTSRGFQSSVDPIMHIGLGKDSIIQSIKVEWPGGKVSVLQNIKADKLIVIDENTAISDSVSKKDIPAKPMFTDVTQSSGINFVHQQSPFVDFMTSPLLPYQISKIGPCIAKADVNGDGLEDLFIGASVGQASELYLQTKDGKFILSKSQPWALDKDNITVADALFFDADNDGKMDLYLVSGGADFNLNNKNYQDILYKNDGHGNFTKVNDALPSETVSGSCVRAADINKDGLTDLFVGGKLSPGMYPKAPESFILINKSTPGHIRFEKDAAQVDSTLKHPGMVTDAVWFDINKDGWEDLIAVGEFMPITVFINHKGILINETKVYGLSETNGWWSRIFADDFDNDGDTDLIVGNLGTNTPFKASVAQPLSITYGDFLDDGTIIPILCSYNNGKSYPYYSKDEMADQIPFIKKKFLSYDDYADTQLKDIFTSEQLAKSKTVYVKTLQSVYLQNEGNKKFSVKPLPPYAQISPVNGIVSEDIDKDGDKDIIIAGNFYPFRTSVGPMDAGMGLVLKDNGTGKFTPLPYALTGLNIQGDTRNMIKLNAGNKILLIVAKNNGKIQVEQLDKNTK